MSDDKTENDKREKELIAFKSLIKVYGCALKCLLITS